jgi:hypothetical protein
MPIESPSPIGNRTHSEFVLCQGFAFRPSNLDGCSHQTYADGSAVTIVNFNTMRDQHDHASDFSERAALGRRLH